MRSIEVSAAKARLSDLVAEAERGRSTTIRRRGRAVAVIVPIGVARQLYPNARRSFADVLLSYPGGVERDSDHMSIREIDL
jgi:antitoxin Phd